MKRAIGLERDRRAALSGLGGTGKSALAIHTARLISDRFPDGLMYADLGASGNTPAGTAEVLAGFLRARGVRTDDIPPGLDERAALWRTMLAGHKVLVMLDDADADPDGDQIGHLLPATAGSAGVVTSGRRIASPPLH